MSVRITAYCKYVFLLLLLIFVNSASADNLVGIAKLSNIASQWLGGGCSPNDWCGGSDLDKSGEIDFNDFAVLAQNWEKYRKPNILFILLDDLGREWISAYGAEDITTPNIDTLSNGGMRFENAYSMPQCTPSRATLMSGQYPWRNGWVHHWDSPGLADTFPPGVPPVRYDLNFYPSFAKMFKSKGYATAVAGKWQINDLRPDPNIMHKFGFDDFCMWPGKELGISALESRYWDPNIFDSNGYTVRTGEFGPDIFTDFLIDFMTDHNEEPMFMYYPMVLTHGPKVATPLEPDVTEKYDKHKAMVRYTDHCLSRLMQRIDDLQIRDHTIVFWTTDNGSVKNVTGHINGRAIKGGKTKITENGINAPFIVNCPGVVPTGAVTDTLTDFTDVFPTFAELIGAPMSAGGPPPGYVFDGHSIAKVITGLQADGHRDWICGIGSNSGVLNMDRDPMMEDVNDYQAVNIDDQKQRGIRDKRYKMLVLGGSPAEPNDLFDLWTDPGETINLMASSDPNHIAARQKLEAVFNSFPLMDAIPLYGPPDP